MGINSSLITIKKLVLVSVVNREKDLKIAIKHHWYRIPVKYAPKKKADYLALYQTRIFNKKGKSINFYAPIKNYSITYRRNLLPEERNHPGANQLYQKLELGPICKTPRSIENKIGLRVNFGFTILEKLLHAKEMGELFNIVPLEQIISRKLQKNNIKTIHQYCIMEKGHCRYRLDFAIFCKKGNIDIECDNGKWHYQPARIKRDRKRNCWLMKHGWEVIHLSDNNIINNLNNCIRTIKHTICSLDGLTSVTQPTLRIFPSPPSGRGMSVKT